MGRKKKTVKYAIDTILEKIGRKQPKPVPGVESRKRAAKDPKLEKLKAKTNLTTKDILAAGKGEFLQAKYGNKSLNLLKNQPPEVIQAARDRSAGLPISKEHQAELEALGAGTSSAIPKATKKAIKKKVKKKSKTKKLNSEE